MRTIEKVTIFASIACSLFFLGRSYIEHRNNHFELASPNEMLILISSMSRITSPIAQMLINRDVWPAAALPSSGYDALYFAVRNGDRDLVQTLLNVGPKKNYPFVSWPFYPLRKFFSGFSTMDTALRSKNLSIINLLAKYQTVYEKDYLEKAINSCDPMLISNALEHLQIAGYVQSAFKQALIGNCKNDLDIVRIFFDKTMLSKASSEVKYELSVLSTRIFSYSEDIADQIEEEVYQKGYTALMHAVSWKKQDLVDLLLKNGFPIDHATRVGKTAMAVALEQDTTEMMNFLSSRGASILKPENNLVFAGVSCLQKDKMDVLAKAKANLGLVVLGAIIAERNKAFSRSDLFQCIDFMTGIGASVSVEHDGMSPLSLAIYAGDSELVKRLLSLGALPRKETSNYFDDLVFASVQPSFEVFSAIFQSNIYSKKVLHDAVLKSALNGAIDKLNFLKKSEVSLNGALVAATENNQMKTVEWLLQQGFHIDEKDHDGHSPLFAATSNCNKTMASLLIEKGARKLGKKNSDEAEYICLMRQKEKLVKQMQETINRFSGSRSNRVLN